MYVHKRVSECDFTGDKYDIPVLGAWCIARGATGRYCCVMYAGPEWLRRQGIVPMSVLEAYEQIEKNGDGYPDF